MLVCVHVRVRVCACTRLRVCMHTCVSVRPFVREHIVFLLCNNTCACICVNMLLHRLSQAYHPISVTVQC